MKLITKTTLLYLLIIGLVISTSGFILYTNANNFIDKQARDYFRYRENRILTMLAEPIPDMERIATFKTIKVELLPKVTKPIIAGFNRDVKLLNDVSGELELYRARTFDKAIKGKIYRITIYMAIQDYVLLTKFIIHAAIYIFLALMVVLLLLNYLSSRYLWQPFNHTLDQIRNYSVNRNQPLLLQPTNTQEFEELNLIIAQMINRIEHDYRNIKEFTDNISHEVQTPLAVIRAKLEMLLKAGNMPEDLFQVLNAIYQSTSRLSRLSKTLGLFSKINNSEFINKEQIQLKTFINGILFNFKELAELKNVKITADLDEHATLYIDSYLLDVLVNNLLKNALTHNHEDGEIAIKAIPHQITISNTGEPLSFPADRIFDRFRKNPDKPQSLGLGLAIVRKICDMNGISIQYSYSKDWHSFTLTF
ncbi:sensor histidine kinase [Adhaeribacter aquaticus]|uniref:sensor histidine kinase n=1 Tax=Adhaeribacter aquaticus TaxID=299567 RepID=UPI0004101159|nr:HAMP domain-containing sensor histidine kinase [Adhaeribacter aquaticus]